MPITKAQQQAAALKWQQVLRELKKEATENGKG